MRGLKLLVILAIFAIGVSACFDSTPERFVIADSKDYKASLFRQNCAICHGPEGDGKTLEGGTMVPSLRTGEFKMRSAAEIHRQIADGGNGMTPFRGLLTEREIKLLTDLVHDDLRGQQR